MTIYKIYSKINPPKENEFLGVIVLNSQKNIKNEYKDSNSLINTNNGIIEFKNGINIYLIMLAFFVKEFIFSFSPEGVIFRILYFIIISQETILIFLFSNFLISIAAKICTLCFILFVAIFISRFFVGVCHALKQSCNRNCSYKGAGFISVSYKSKEQFLN